MTRLNQSAKSALDTLQEKHLAYTIAKTTIEQELKRELQQRLAAIRHERDMSVRIAADAGVPKTQLGKAIGTSNYKTIQDILAQVESVMPSAGPSVAGKMSVVAGNVQGEFIVTLSNFGDQGISGQATITFGEDDVETTGGDAFVLPQIYRNNAIDDLLRQVQTAI
jgi:DNA-binding phage protein